MLFSRSLSRRNFVRTTSLAAAAAAHRPLAMAAHARDAAAPEPLKEFSYGSVRLSPGLPRTQFDQTQDLLLGMDADSLLKPYRLRAGLPAPGADMGGWYDEVTLDKTPSGGHGFAPGHALGQWISAMARGYAVTGDPRMRQKADDLLGRYGDAISGRFYANFRFPAYNYDKLVCGLSDAHEHMELDPGFGLLHRTTAAAEPHLPPTALDRDGPQRAWRASIGENTANDYCWDESYTLPENLFLAWQRGAGANYRRMAERFLLDKTWFTPLAAGQNVLAGHHAYSFCNSLSSAAQAYLATGSRPHLDAARNGFAMIDQTQSFATGGWGPDESFREPDSDDMYRSLGATHKSFETPCGSYAHFKLSRYLLRITRDGAYGDSMERVLYNTVLGAKRLEPDGSAFYYSDYNNDGARTYFPDKWPCCSGTLPQVAADYHLLVYFHDDEALYVNLYLPSAVRWVAPGGEQVELLQGGEYPEESDVRLTVQCSKPANFRLRFRIPAWASTPDQVPVEIRVNGAIVAAPVTLGFATIDRTWQDGDRVSLTLPLPIRLAPIDPRHPNTVAVMRGPLVLFAMNAGPVNAIPRRQLDGLRRGPGRNWQAGELSFARFTELADRPYRTYLDVL